jgi:protein SCO1
MSYLSQCFSSRGNEVSFRTNMVVAQGIQSLVPRAAMRKVGQWTHSGAGWTSRFLIFALLCGWLMAGGIGLAEPITLPSQSGTNIQNFRTEGVVKELKGDGRTVVIAHEAIPNYMEAMTMPFKVRQPRELAGLQAGDKILFRLRVSDTESWVEGISKIGSVPADRGKAAQAPAGKVPAPKPRHPLQDYPFTNELGQAVRLSDFRGQALAITFFFTRCPIPDFCPRLSRNFEEASQKLSALPGGPTNWHFLSVSFDPEFDTPSVLKAYAKRYQYDPNHWSFLTGPKEKISELASGSDVKFEREGGFINHNFRTLIIDAAGHLEMMFPVGGNLSEAIVAEVLKAAAVPATQPGPKEAKAGPQTAALAP